MLTVLLVLPRCLGSEELGDAACEGFREPWKGCRNWLLPQWPSLGELVLSHTDSG